MSDIEDIRCGDYLLPNLTAGEPSPEDTEPLGRYARMRRSYLREWRPILYSKLILQGRLFPHLREIDTAAQNRLSTIPNREVAHEIILAELVYDEAL